MDNSITPTNQDLRNLMGSHKPDRVTGAYEYLFSCAGNYEGKMFAYDRLKEYLEKKSGEKSQANPSAKSDADWVVVPHN